MIVVDVETTGLRPEINSIVSIGAVDFSNPKNQFYEECRIWKGAEINPIALKINGFTEGQLRDPNKQSLGELMQKFSEYISKIPDQTLAGQNPWFDGGFLRDSAERCRLEGYSFEKRFGSRCVDIHTLIYARYLSSGMEHPLKNGRTSIDFNKALEYAGLPPEPEPHNALTGAKMGAEVLSRLIYGKNLLPEFSQYSIPDYLLK